MTIGSLLAKASFPYGVYIAGSHFDDTPQQLEETIKDLQAHNLNTMLVVGCCSQETEYHGEVCRWVVDKYLEVSDQLNFPSIYQLTDLYYNWWREKMYH